MPTEKTSKSVGRKFLKVIYEIQKSFGVDFVGVSRTFSFGIKPSGSEREKLEKWFERVNAVKDNLYRTLFEDFKELPAKYLGAKFDYGRFRGKNLIKGIPTQPLQEGLRMEIQGSVRSFITNHSRTFEESQKDAGSICNVVKENDQVINSCSGTATFDFDSKRLLSELEKLQEIDYESVRSSFSKFQAVNELIDRINSLIGDYNYELNQFAAQSKTKDIKKLTPLSRLNRLTSFPGIKLEHPPDLETPLKELEQLACKAVDQNKVVAYIRKAAERAKSWVGSNQEDKYDFHRRRTPFDRRLAYWLEKSEKIDKHKVGVFIQALEKKLSRLKQHLLKKPYDGAARTQYLNLLGLRARLSCGVGNDEVNLLRSRYIGGFLRVRSEREVITLPGFSWGERVPLKNVAFGFRGSVKDGNPNIKSLFICIATSSKPFRIVREAEQGGNFFFLKTSGGSRKKTARKPKTVEYLPGHFDLESEGTPLMLALHFGKSHARRYLTNVKWGLFSANPRVFLNNARLKRIKRNPGDEWNYFFDITLSADEKVFGLKQFSQDILRRTKTVIGVDRGEVNPVAYAVISRNNGVVASHGVLGRKEYREKLDEYIKKRELQQSRGRLVSRSLRGKIARLQKTTLETAVSEILHLAAKYRAAIAIEDLGGSFRGSERSIIPRKTYKKVETLLANSLNFAGLLRIAPRKPKYWGNLILVRPYATSSTCTKCGAMWFSKKPNKKLELAGGTNFYIDEIVADSKRKDFSNVDCMRGNISFGKLRLSLNNSWVSYDPFRRREVKLSLADLGAAITQKNVDEASRLLAGALSHRPRRDVFICHACGFSDEADINAAVNIARRGVDSIYRLLTKSKSA